MFIHETTLRNARIIDVDELGGEMTAIHELVEEWQRHLFCDEDGDAI